MILRDYQQKCVSDVKQSYLKGFNAPLLVVPTGGGKTVIFSHMAWSSVNRGKHVLILVHRIELLRQTQNKLGEFGLEAGLINGKFTPNYSAPIQIGMVQSMKTRLNYYPNFDFIITDECHHVAANSYLSTLQAYPNAYQLGVTATPIRLDGKGLGIGHGGVYDDLICGPTVRELMDMGHLVEPEIYLPPIFLDRNMKKSMGDFSKREAAVQVDRDFITGNAVDHYCDLAKYEPGVTFCVNVQHAQNVAAEYRSRGLKSYCVDGSMDDRERDRILKGLADGSVHVVTSCEVISEGTDIPAIYIGTCLRPTESEGLHMQQIGRTLRPAPGKTKSIWLDHVGNCGQIIDGQLKVNLGFPDDEKEWSLIGVTRGKRDNGAPKITLCENCYLAYKASMVKCPHCGSGKQSAPWVDPKVVAGELKRIEAEEKLQATRMAKSEVNQARTLKELKEIAKARGHHHKWAERVFYSRTENQGS